MSTRVMETANEDEGCFRAWKYSLGVHSEVLMTLLLTVLLCLFLIEACDSNVRNLERLVIDVNEVKQNPLGRTMQSLIAFRFESIKLERAFFFYSYSMIFEFILS